MSAGFLRQMAFVPFRRPYRATGLPSSTKILARRDFHADNRLGQAAVVGDPGDPLMTRTVMSSGGLGGDGQVTDASPQVRMLLVGCPGSGKGTLSTLLHSTYPWLSSISAGDLLRQNIERKTQLGKAAEDIIRRGELMDDETMMKMVGKEVEARGDKSWLLDGFPRTTGQARLLDEALKEQGRPLNLVVHLDVPEDAILQRILGRWVHPPSGRVYNLQYNPPKIAGKDDETGEPLVQRPDDNEETLASRLAAFHKQTGPMIQHYSSTSSRPPLSLALSKAPEPRNDERVYVSLKGETSKVIWPLLQGVMRWRYGIAEGKGAT